MKVRSCSLISSVEQSIQQLMGKRQLCCHRQLLAPTVPQQPASVGLVPEALTLTVHGIHHHQIAALRQPLALSPLQQMGVIPCKR